jgi:hypothetical protein
MLMVLSALLKAAEEKRYRGTEEPLMKLALEYGAGVRVTRAEVLEVLSARVSEVVSLGQPRPID